MQSKKEDWLLDILNNEKTKTIKNYLDNNRNTCHILIITIKSINKDDYISFP